MKIAVDCRYLGKSGLGRVCEGILDCLDYQKDTFYLIGKREKLQKYKDAVIIPDETEPYSKAGLTQFSKERVNRECDCLLIPNFLIPFGIKIPVHTVMHDLIFLDLPAVTTNGFADRMLKKYLLKRCMKKSVSISCVSEFTRMRCEAHFGKRAKKCYTNHIGLSETVLSYRGGNVVKQNKILFLGNVKPHKGLDTLLSAFRLLPAGYELKIIGKRENFLTGVGKEVSEEKGVTFTGEISDEELFGEIESAKYLVQPSLYEGFGLPPLEAMCLGTQPVVSDIPVFREVYRDLPVKIFRSEEELADILQTDPDMVACKELIAERYDYHKTVQRLSEHWSD